MRHTIVFRLYVSLAATIGAVASASADDVVLTTSGAPLKVVVRVATSVHERPEASSAGRPVPMFAFFYVLPPKRNTTLSLSSSVIEPALEAGYFRVAKGTSEKDEEGWISRDDVVVWPHRQAIQMRPIAGRKPALFYKTESDLKTAFTGGAPTPFSKEPAAGAGLSLMPLLDQISLKGASSDESTGYRVAYLHAVPSKGGAPNPGASDSGKAKIELAQSSLDVVFVIDATGSMQPFIDATKQVVSDLANRLAGDPKNKVPVRLGLVAYRDRVEQPTRGWYIAKTFWNLDPLPADGSPVGTDIARFLEALQDVKADGGDETAEDVLAGLETAVKLPGWNPNGFKHIILIGDASGHVDADDAKNPERRTVEGVRAMMQPSGRDNLNAKMICHSVRIVGEDPTDYAHCEEQFAKLAEGVDFPGLYQVFDAKNKPAFVNRLVDVILKSREGLHAATSGAAAGGGRPASDTPGLGLLLEMVAASTAGEGDVPAFASGYVAATDPDGKEQVEPYLLVQFGQIRTFQSILNLSVNAVRSAGDPGSRDVEKIVQTLQIACTQLSINEPIKPETPLHVIFSFLLGFPVRSDIFTVTPQILASMTQEDFDQWTKKIEACDSIIKGYIDRPNLWKSLGRSTSPDSQYSFLRISELP